MALAQLGGKPLRSEAVRHIPPTAFAHPPSHFDHPDIVHCAQNALRIGCQLHQQPLDAYDHKFSQ